MADDAPQNARTVGAGGRCPICKQPTVVDYRPFCSKRCADVDLGRWLGGVYAIPETDVGDDDRSPIAAANDDTPDDRK